MHRLLSFLLCCLPPLLFALPPLQPVQHIDIKKYMGTWHEIARIPNDYQEGCRDTQATYTLRANGDINMANQCTQNGEITQRTGKAWPQQSGNYTYWYTQYVWPFKGDYWILYIDKHYQYAMAGTPSRNYLWLLSRSKKMSKSVYNKLLSVAKSQHYDIKRLHKD